MLEFSLLGQVPTNALPSGFEAPKRLESIHAITTSMPLQDSLQVLFHLGISGRISCSEQATPGQFTDRSVLSLQGIWLQVPEMAKIGTSGPNVEKGR